MAKRIAIIGGGSSGIVAIKCCLDEGLEPVCFERTSDIGGLWNFTENVRDQVGCVMKTTVINTSKEMMPYSDYLIPADYPNFMHNTKVMEYFHDYVKHFGLDKYIKFNTRVLSVKKTEDFIQTGQWKLEIQYQDGKVETEIFDAVYICTGHHADKRLPNFEGHDIFEGKQVHTHDFKDHRGYEDKRVVVIGIGNSGGDVTVELSRIAKQVYLSTRHGAWVMNRVMDYGVPFDIAITRRVANTLQNILGENLSNRYFEAQLNSRFDHEAYRLKPHHRFNAQHPTVSDELPNRIACGSVIIKPNIVRLHKNSVEFDDGTVEENIDTVIYATGYKLGFPFLEKGIIDVQDDNKVNLFKYAFPPDLEKPTLVVIACIQPIGAIMPIAELQSRWAARVFKGVTKLPSSEEMWADIRKKQQTMAERYVTSPRHTIQVDWIPFMDDVAKQFGCKPNIAKLFLTDPALAFKVYFGPCTPYQYRLHGPGQWKGARQAIMTAEDRVYKPFQTRPINTKKNTGFNVLYIIALVILAVMIKLIFF